MKLLFLYQTTSLRINPYNEGGPTKAYLLYNRSENFHFLSDKIKNLKKRNKSSRKKSLISDFLTFRYTRNIYKLVISRERIIITSYNYGYTFEGRGYQLDLPMRYDMLSTYVSQAFHHDQYATTLIARVSLCT